MLQKDTRSLRLTRFDITRIYNFLINRDSPVMEIDLLRFLTGDQRMPPDRGHLFEIHFSLYHSLYQLKTEAGLHGFYLHLDPMRISLVKIPPAGMCDHFFPHTGTFCQFPEEIEGYCAGHRADCANGSKPLYDPLYTFYTNEENISFGKNELLNKLMNGIVIYALRKGEIDRALKLFDLHSPSLKKIQCTYRELAKAYHPDKNNGDDTKMKELNSSYQVLKEVFVL